MSENCQYYNLANRHIEKILLLGVSLVSIINPTNVTEIPATPAYAESITLEEQAKNIASEYGVSFSLMKNIVDDESKWNPNAIGDGGRSFGLVQINLDYHPEITESQARDPVFALKMLAIELLHGNSWKWTVCNCKAETRRLGAYTPSGEFEPNSNYPRVGGVVIMKYGDVIHYAFITSVEKDGIHVQETNYEPCKRTKRILQLDDEHIVGYWHHVE